jgi:fucose 4-O-acetylase-like acetyltransferase
MPKVCYENRKINIDILRFICAFLVVCIHVEFSWDNGYMAAIATIAVPIFFMISGFFYSQTITCGKAKKQIVKIQKLVIVSNIFYLVWHLIIYGISGGGMDYLKTTITVKSAAEFVIFNESPFSIHLWYLGAILYVLIISQTAIKKNVFDSMYYLIPFLLIGDLVLGKYSVLLWGKDIYYLYSRNCLFFALPYFLLGALIKKKYTVIADFLQNRKYLLVVAIPVFTATLITERYILIHNNLNATREQYLSTTLLAVSAFLLALVSKENKRFEIVAKIGRENSTFIYIVHMFIKDFIALLVPMSLTGRYYIIRPIIVFAISVVASIMIKIMKNSLQICKNKVTLLLQ